MAVSAPPSDPFLEDGGWGTGTLTVVHDTIRHHTGYGDALHVWSWIPHAREGPADEKLYCGRRYHQANLVEDEDSQRPFPAAFLFEPQKHHPHRYPDQVSGPYPQEPSCDLPGPDGGQVGWVVLNPSATSIQAYYNDEPGAPYTLHWLITH